MTDTPELPQADDRSIVERAKAILLKPANEWPRIAASAETPGDMITRYAMPLAAIGPLAAFVHGQVFGYGALGLSWKPGLVAGLGSAVATYVLGLVGVIVLALIADWLAPKFSGVSNRTAAFKLVVYGSTAAWLAGIAQLLPGLGLLGLAGLYSLYLYYLGATPVMKVPQDKAAGYTAVTIACAVVLYLVIGGVSGAFLTMMGSGAAITAPDSGKVSGALSIPGVGKVDLDKVQQAADQMEAQSKGEAKAVAPDALKDLLPAAIGPFQRTGVESGAVGGLGSNATGTYENGDKRFTLRITDMSAVGALAGLGAAMGVSQSKEDADGYERTGVVNGQMQSEKWNKTDHRGSFGHAIANRFMVEAEGDADSIDQLKAAVATVDAGKLAGLGGQ
ncbi:Yip1 family protein [Novosphingobium sp. EMRT-2]|uniref:Yip1 family protein n=1 Tax=Novosphingobium sp. EMRT-2 TaxID=2571749 RepID=UPI0010BD8FFF|nr:Yip1 family protein [Novosphingobium sp. EMRT-2]QCI92728.1 YIP1 family protein [Novosphingobium sp. EMRT-2]